MITPLERPKPGVNSSPHIVTEDESQLKANQEIDHLKQLTNEAEAGLLQALPIIDHVIEVMDR